MDWIREGPVFAPGPPDAADRLRELRPSVLEEDGGTLRMWYSGHDGITGRILTAVRRPGQAWERLGIAIDVGFAGDSDQYAVESPSVVRTPGGYLMAYAGFDGDATRLHMATSADGHVWTPQGTIMRRGPEEAVAASHPCLMTTATAWWLFFSGYDGSRDSRQATILAAVSGNGASWDRVGIVLGPGEGELAVSHPSVLISEQTFHMFYASDDGDRVSIAMATSPDGVSWHRHGTTLAASGSHPEARGVHSPCVLRRQDGSLQMWYAGLADDDPDLAYRICTARFPGPWSR
jgi:predicted GH43/DUF377 family glycosyl hydrolase